MIIKSIEFIRFSKCIPIANTMGIGMVLLIKNDHISVERNQHFGMLQTAQNVAAVEKEKKNLVTGRANSNKNVLSTSSSLTSGCSLMHKTKRLEGENLTVASQQCSSSFITPHPYFLNKTWNSCHSPTSLLSRFGSWGLQVDPKIQDTNERILF